MMAVVVTTLVVIPLSGQWGGHDWDALRRRIESNPEFTTGTRRPPVEAAGLVFDGMKFRLYFYSCELGVEPSIAFALAEHESAWNPKARSPKGALGILQVLPETAALYGLNKDRLLEFDYGAYAGLVILRDLLSRFNSEAVALAAYYAGPVFWKQKYPVETQAKILQYVRSVVAKKQRYANIRCSRLAP